MLSELGKYTRSIIPMVLLAVSLSACADQKATPVIPDCPEDVPLEEILPYLGVGGECVFFEDKERGLVRKAIRRPGSTDRIIYQASLDGMSSWETDLAWQAYEIGPTSAYFESVTPSPETVIDATPTPKTEEQQLEEVRAEIQQIAGADNISEQLLQENEQPGESPLDIHYDLRTILQLLWSGGYLTYITGKGIKNFTSQMGCSFMQTQAYKNGEKIRLADAIKSFWRFLFPRGLFGQEGDYWERAAGDADGGMKSLPEAVKSHKLRLKYELAILVLGNLALFGIPPGQD